MSKPWLLPTWANIRLMLGLDGALGAQVRPMWGVGDHEAM